MRIFVLKIRNLGRAAALRVAREAMRADLPLQVSSIVKGSLNARRYAASRKLAAAKQSG
jgi:hypothetical protein